MRIEALEGFLNAKPFVPFRIVLPTDRSVAVPHPEFVSIAPNKRWILIWNKNSTWNVIDPALVVEVAFSRSRRRRSS